MGIPCLLEQLQYDKWSINAIYQRALDRNPIRRAAIRPLLAFSWAPCFSIHDNTQAACRVRCSLMRDGTQEQLWKLAFDTPPPKCALRNIPTPQSLRARKKMVPWPGRLRPTPSLDNHRTQTWTHTHLEISPPQLIWATRACTRWLISTPDIPLSSANVNTIALVPQIALQPRKTRLTFHWAAFCALY